MVDAILLAAGAGRRIGQPKALLPYGGQTMVECVLDALNGSTVRNTAVVLRPGSEAAPLVRAKGAEGVENPAPDRGMLSSVVCGLEWIAARQPCAEGVLVALVDQPQMTTAIIDTMVAAFERRRSGIVIPTHQGRHGHPPVFALSYRDEILALGPDEGLNVLPLRHAAQVTQVPIDSPLILHDIDTPQDYHAAQ